MGFMMIVENFDEWEVAKCKNGYHRFFDEWAEKDMVNMLRHFRNNPSVVMWSIGNEVPTQCSNEGYKVPVPAGHLPPEDPTRPVTSGMDQISCVLDNGFAAVVEVPGFNYRTHRYVEAYENSRRIWCWVPKLLPPCPVVYTSSRGEKADALYDDHQSSSYDLEHCSWSNIPMRILFWPMITIGHWDNSSGPVSITWASLRPMTPMHGLITAPCLEL